MNPAPTRRRLANLALLLLVVSACSSERTLSAPTVDQGNQPTEIDARSVTIDLCFNDQNALQKRNRTLLSVECRLNHDNQVFAVVDLGAVEAPFTSVEQLDTQAFALCQPLFEGFVGRPHGDSQFEIQTLVPSADTWAEGDRQGGCVIYKTDRSTWVGTGRNSGI